MSTPITIKLRRGLAAQWAAENPVLAAGEPGVETDTGRWKTGDGATNWNELPYYGPNVIVSQTEPANPVLNTVWIKK